MLELKEQLRARVTFLDAKQWAALRGIAGTNPSAAIGKYKQERRLFAVHEGRSDLYPAFQFTDHGEPLPGIALVLAAVPSELDPWSLLSWFDAPNTLLKKQRPSELIATKPERVVVAARRYYARD